MCPRIAGSKWHKLDGIQRRYGDCTKLDLAAHFTHEKFDGFTAWYQWEQTDIENGEKKLLPAEKKRCKIKNFLAEIMAELGPFAPHVIVAQ